MLTKPARTVAPSANNADCVLRMILSPLLAARDTPPLIIRFRYASLFQIEVGQRSFLCVRPQEEKAPPHGRASSCLRRDDHEIATRPSAPRTRRPSSTC